MGSPHPSVGCLRGEKADPGRRPAFHLGGAKGALSRARNETPLGAIPLRVFGLPGEPLFRTELRGWTWPEHVPGDGGAVVGPAVAWSAGGAGAPEPPPLVPGAEWSGRCGAQGARWLGSSLR